jgi:hypothetical protein
LGRRAVGAHTIFDGDNAAVVLAKRGINQAVVVADVAVDDGEVFLLDGAGFPDFAEFAGDNGIFGDEDDTAGFAVEAVDQMSRKLRVEGCRLQIEAGAADEAGKFIAFGGMTNQSRRFVDGQQVSVFVDDVEQFVQLSMVAPVD